MMKKDIEDMTIFEYMEYEAEMKRKPWKNAQFYYPTNRDTNSLSRDRSRILEYERHSNNSNINAYLPPFIPFFKPVQPPIKNMYEPLNKNTDVVSEDESKTIEQEMKKEERDTSGTLLCQLPPKELNLGSFTLPCTIGNLNLYAMADLGASVNIMPKSIFKHLKPANLKETSMERMGCSNNGCVFEIMKDKVLEVIGWYLLTSLSKLIRNEVFNEWLKDSFDIEIDFGKTLDDPYSRRFDEYKEEFDSKIKQLANEYDLRVGSRKKNGGKMA
nr:hypothetical protein [Tanacetum cinerariifolium]